MYDWKNKYPDISNALKKGKEVSDYEVENALFLKAKSGDVTAMIFWLKNRRTDKWRDKPESKEESSTVKKLDEVMAKLDGVMDNA